MATFAFKIVDLQGEVVHGSMQGPNREWAVQRLSQVSRTVLECAEKEDRGLGGLGIKHVPSVKKESLAVYCRQLATMVKAGIPVNRAIRFCGEGEDQRLNVVMQQVANEIEAGKSVSQAFDKYSQTFGEIFIALTKSGEDSGTLDLALDRLSELLEKSVRMQKKVQSAMAYPSIILLVSIAVSALFAFYILPMMVPVFVDLGVNLPWPTKILVWFANTLGNPWIGIPVFGLAALSVLSASFVYRNLEQTPALRYEVDTWLMKVPVLGQLLILSAQARVLYTMSTMLNAGVSLSEVMMSVQKVAAHAVLSKRLHWAREELINGASFFNCLTKYDAFEPMALQMIKVGEETGTLDRMVMRVAEMYEQQVEHLLEILSSLLEPIIMAVMGVVVGFITLASFLPMIQLLNNL